MPIAKILAILLLTLVASIGFSQVQTIRGVVRDAVSNDPIPFVHLRITGKAYGTSTNLDGHFEIKLDPTMMAERDLSLTLSCIGYESMVISSANIQPVNEFRLKATTTSLSSITVTASKPSKKLVNRGRRLVQKAFRKVPGNYHSATVQLPSFYRHYCAENGTYVRLIEAAMDIYRPERAPYQVSYPGENLEFEVTQLRRSFDFTESARLSHPSISLNFLLSNDLTAYEYSNPFFAKRNVEYALRDTTTFDNERIVLVDFRAPTTPAHPEAFDGTLYIGLSDFAFHKMEVHERFTRGTISDSINLHIHKTTFFKKQDARYFLDRTISDLRALHLSFDSLGLVVDSVAHLSHIELITNDVVLDPGIEIKGKEPTKDELREIAYDSTVWSRYTILEATDLEKRIIEDLSERLSLEQQFAMFNDIESGGKSVIASDKFQQMLESYAGTPTYVILWASWAHPNYFDIDPDSYLAKRLKKDQADLVLISLDDQEEEWLMSRMVYQLDRKGIRHERLDFEFDSEVAQQYFKNVLPYRCFFDAQGRLVEQSPPLPNDPMIREYLQPILQNRTAAETDTQPPPTPQNQN